MFLSNKEGEEKDLKLGNTNRRRVLSTGRIMNVNAGRRKIVKSPHGTPAHSSLVRWIGTPSELLARFCRRKARRIQNLIWKTVTRTDAGKCVMLKTNYVLPICKSISANNFHLMKKAH